MQNLIHRMKPADAGFYPLTIPYAAKFDGVSTTYLDWVASVDQDDYLAGTISLWAKIPDPKAAWQEMVTGSTNSNYRGGLRLSTGYLLGDYRVWGGSTTWLSDIPPYVRDTAQWYHFLWVFDAVQASVYDRVRFWINGVTQTTHFTSGSIATSSRHLIGANGYHTLIGNCYGYSAPFTGYLADIHFLDGIALDPTYFGEYKYQTWIPKRYNGSYGTNGFHLDFADSSDLGKDVSGNGNHFTNNGDAVEQTIDTPTNNFPIFDALWPVTYTLSDEGLTVTTLAAATYAYPTNIAIPKSGIWRMQFAPSGTYANRNLFGVMTEVATGAAPWTTVEWAGYFGLTGDIYAEGSVQDTGDTFTDGDIIDVIFDADNLEITFYKNGTIQYTEALSTFTGKDWFFAMGDGASSYACVCTIENGVNDFTYTLTGIGANAKPICTANLPNIDKINGADALWLPTWEGSQPDAQDILGAPFDLTTGSKLIWVKNRDYAANNFLVDTVRGLANVLHSNTTDIEDATGDSGFITGLSSGFNVDTNSTYAELNGSGYSYIAWVLNMLPLYGMDIVTYTGNGTGLQVAHSLGVPPELIIVKSLETATLMDWMVGCQYTDASNPWGYYLKLNSTAVKAAGAFAGVSPTSTYFTVGTHQAVNESGVAYVAYLFRSLPGIIDVGYYLGNGSTNGPRIYTNFRTRFLMIKDVDAAYNWNIMDSEREQYNILYKPLNPGSTASEDINTNYATDFLSNGFKKRAADNQSNRNTNRYIYLAIADMAFPYCNAF